MCLLVCSVLCVLPQQDIANSSGRMRAAADALRKARGGGVVFADELIAWEVKELGIPRMRKDQHSGVKGMLWMKRALDFIFSLLSNMFCTMKNATSKECALEAYDRILKPYHSECVTPYNTESRASLCASLHRHCAAYCAAVSACV